MRSKGLNKWLTNPPTRHLPLRLSFINILTHPGSWMKGWWRSCWWWPCWCSCWRGRPWTPGAGRRQSQGCRRGPDSSEGRGWCCTAQAAPGALTTHRRMRTYFTPYKAWSYQVSLSAVRGDSGMGNPCQSNTVTVIWTAAPCSLRLRGRQDSLNTILKWK